MPHLNAVHAAAALLGFVLLSGCGASVPPAAESEGHTQTEIPKQVDSSGDQSTAPDMVSAERVLLISVTDGDTVKVGLIDGSGVNVRLIGIDTPETYPEVECGGPQATAHLRRLIGPGDTLSLYIDPTRDEADRYGRLLRYVFTGNGADVGLDQIATGHGSVYVYNNNPFVALDTYQDAEDDVRSDNGGNWGAC